MKNNPDVILASQSPRRQELLKQAGISFDVFPVDIDESILVDEKAVDYVTRLAKEKAQAGFNQSKREMPVLGSDTAVVINEQILGKPVDRDEAAGMLRLLSGKTHRVLTAVALAQKRKKSTSIELSHILSVSELTFTNLSENQIIEYVQTGECDDKAGAYAIQGRAAIYIAHLSGSYSGVMGLPLYETMQLLKKAGIR